MPVTCKVLGRRAADEAKMPPPQPMSRYVCFWAVEGEEEEEEEEEAEVEEEERQVWIKSWRRGFMRCRRREGPWGSHQLEARREKWTTSVCETEEGEG